MHEFHLDITAGRDRTPALPLDETPFRIAILGDFSGRASRGANQSGSALARRPAWPVDRDDIDIVMREMGVTVALELEAGAPPLAIGFQSLDDFHPERLYQRLPLFQALRDLRQRLSNPNTFQAAVAEMSGAAPSARSNRPAAGASLLGDILDASAPADVEEVLADAGGDLHGFIQRILKPHLVPNPDPRQAELVAQVDAAASATLRRILHAPEFQAVEGLWRGIDFVARQLETGPDLKLLLLDVSEAELRAALPAEGDPGKSPLFALLARDTETAPWGLLIGAYRFGPSGEEVDRLGQLAAMAQALGAPWVSAAAPELAGVGPEMGELSTWVPPSPAWQALRSTSLARSLGLVLPRFLARLPYGKGLEECEGLQFEELEPGKGSEQLLLGNPALILAVILGRGFTENRWRLMQGLEQEVSGLPVGTVGRGADAVAVGPGEAPLAVRAADALMERGFMPLAPLKDTDRVGVVRVQSCAAPAASLAGRWG
jgi:type VI secretion system protein ImpC